jgi:hypothetical protein
MTMGDFLALATGLAAVLGAGLSIWNFIQSPSKSNANAIEKLVTKLTDHDRRIQAVENELHHLPDKDMVHELKIAIVELQGTVRGLSAELTTVSRTVINIDKYMREDDRK